MAKVKGTVGPSSSSKSKKANDEPTTSSMNQHTRSKSTDKTPKKASSKGKTKRSTANTDIDSGFSSPEPVSRTRNSDKPSAAKISMKSKKAISKSRKNSVKTSVVKKLSDVSWMKGLIEVGDGSNTQTVKERKLASGIQVRYPGSLSLRKENGVDYLMFPYKDGKCGGYVRMISGSKKLARKARSTLHFFVLMGKIELIAASKVTEFKNGAMLTIPKGVRYGLQNTGRETAFLRYQTIHGGDSS